MDMLCFKQINIHTRFNMSTPVGLPQFSRIDVDQFKSHLEVLLKNHLEQIDTLLKENHHYTWDNLMYPLDDLDDSLERFWSPLSHLHSVMDSKPLRECYDACLPLLSAYQAAVGHNYRLYEAIKSINQITSVVFSAISLYCSSLFAIRSEASLVSVIFSWVITTLHRC